MNAPSTYRTTAAILIAVAAGLALGRIFATQRVYEPAEKRAWPSEKPRAMATFSSNDRVRWATVRALVEDGTFVIGKRDVKTIVISAATPIGSTDPLVASTLAASGFFARISKKTNTGIVFEDGWESVDKVLHPVRNEFLSTKPPLLSTLMAGVYWILLQLTGWTLSQEPNLVVRLLLSLVHIGPFVLYLWLLARLIEKYASSDFGKLLALTAACFATIVTPFLNTFNNHTLGTFAILWCLYCVVRIDELRKDPTRSTFGLYLLAGLSAGFGVTNELPAASFGAAIFCLLLYWSPRNALIGFLPGALLFMAGFFATNYLATGQLRPAYSEFGGIWYEFEGSHWRKPEPGMVRSGIDYAWTKESYPTYVMHNLVGHHGIFSLTPLWLLAVVACCFGWKGQGGLPWYWRPLTLILFLIVVGYYLSKRGPNGGGNYGGFTVGPRWLMWLTPMLIVSMLPVVDWLGKRRWGRGFCYVALAISAVTAQYPGWNPWRHPWLYEWMDWAGWVAYQ